MNAKDITCYLEIMEEGYNRHRTLPKKLKSFIRTAVLVVI